MRHPIPLSEFNLVLRAAMQVGDVLRQAQDVVSPSNHEITWSRLLSRYRVSDLGAELIIGETVPEPPVGEYPFFKEDRPDGVYESGNDVGEKSDGVRKHGD